MYADVEHIGSTSDDNAILYAHNDNDSGGDGLLILRSGAGNDDVWTVGVDNDDSNLKIVNHGNLSETPRLVLDDAGYMGGGNSNPTAAVDIINSNAQIQLEDNSGFSTGFNVNNGDRFLNILADNSLNDFHYGLRAGGNGNQFLGSINIIQTHGSGFPQGEIAFFTTNFGNTGAGERVRINATGNVGIGTTNPTHLLHVNGTLAQPLLLGRPHRTSGRKRTCKP